MYIGAQLGNSERGAGIFVRKDEIKHGLSPSVKCVAPLFRDHVLCQSMKCRTPPHLVTHEVMFVKVKVLFG